MRIEPFCPCRATAALWARRGGRQGLPHRFMLRRGISRAIRRQSTHLRRRDRRGDHYRGVEHYLGRGADRPASPASPLVCAWFPPGRAAFAGRSRSGARRASSRPEEGIDAIAIVADLVASARRLRAASGGARASLARAAEPDLLAHPWWRGHQYRARAPQLKFDRARAARNHPGGLAKSKPRHPWPSAWIARPPYHAPALRRGRRTDVPEDAAIIAVAAPLAAPRASGRGDGRLFGSDAAVMTRAGSATKSWPRQYRSGPTADEFVSVAEVARAARMLVDVARRFA